MKEDKKKKKNAELDEIRKEITDLNDKYLRTLAELQNIGRRNEAEKEKLFKYEGEGIINKLLPIIDDFERAINMDDDNLDDEVSKFLSGIKMIYSNFISVLNSMEVKAFIPLGEEFDPNRMNAIMVEEKEGEKENMVIEVFQNGYLYKDKVIRPAMVKVSK